MLLIYVDLSYPFIVQIDVSDFAWNLFVWFFAGGNEGRACYHVPFTLESFLLTKWYSDIFKKELLAIKAQQFSNGNFLGKSNPSSTDMDRTQEFGAPTESHSLSYQIGTIFLPMHIAPTFLAHKINHQVFNHTQA